jgi:ABC-2 type transport system ATP-binding protein
MAETVILAEGLSKRYGSHPALHGLDLAVAPGEVFGFLGPNGAGKTTAIRLLLDLLRPSAGTVRVLGEDPCAGGARLRRRIGYLPGDLRLEGRQTGRELLTFLGNLRGGSPADASTCWPSGWTWTSGGRSVGCPRATSRRSAWCRRSWATRSC